MGTAASLTRRRDSVPEPGRALTVPHQVCPAEGQCRCTPSQVPEHHSLTMASERPEQAGSEKHTIVCCTLTAAASSQSCRPMC